MNPPTPPPIGSRVQAALRRLNSTPVVLNRGRVTEVVGLVIESAGPRVAVGEICRIQSATDGEEALAEVVGFRDQRVLLMALGPVHGLQPGSMVTALGKPLQAPVGDEVLGRVLDPLGVPLDTLGPLRSCSYAPIHASPPHPLGRERIRRVFETGIKATDTFIPLGRGQRLGIFAGAGVGKSTLLGMVASHAEADVNVIALIGERGREVREFLERDLDERGRRKSVVVVATSNQPAPARVKGAFLAMTIAEHFREEGRNVLFMMDSVTRFAMAQREIGLAVGEPPATRGYTPSVFALLPQLLERAGNSERGTLTGLFAVLVEADDLNDPVGDAVRSILDGHVVLSRELANRNHYPAIDVLESISRLTSDLTSPEQKALLADAREMLGLYRKNQDMIQIGAYVAGTNPKVDRAILLHEPLDQFLRQGMREGVAAEESWRQLRRTLQPPTPPPSRASPAKPANRP